MNLVRLLLYPASFTAKNPILTVLCAGDLQPVEVEVPLLVEDEEEEPVDVVSSNKGKRKAPE